MAILIILKDNGPKEKGMEKDCVIESIQMVKKLKLNLVFGPMAMLVNKAIDLRSWVEQLMKKKLMDSWKS